MPESGCAVEVVADAALAARAYTIDAVFFSFATADEDYHAPNELFRLDGFRDGLAGWCELLGLLGRD